MSQGFYPDNTAQNARALAAVGIVNADPSVTATVGAIGQLVIEAGTTNVWQKQDNGRTTNWLAFGGGGGGVPALPFNSVQFNNAGAFGGDAELTYDATTDYLQIGAANVLTAGARVFAIGSANPGLQGTDSIFIGSNINTGGFNYNQTMVLGNNITGAFASTRSLLIGNGHILAGNLNNNIVTGNANTVYGSNSIIGGGSHNIPTVNSLVVGAGNVGTANSTNSMWYGNGCQANLVTSSVMGGGGNILHNVQTSLIGGEGNTDGAGTFQASVLSGISNTLAAGGGTIIASIITGASNVFGAVGVMDSSVVGGSGTTFNSNNISGCNIFSTNSTFGAGTTIANSGIYGDASTIDSNISSSVITGVGTLPAGMTVSRSVLAFEGISAGIGTIVNSMMVANASTFAGTSSGTVGAVDTSSLNAVVYSATIGDAHALTNLEYSAVIGSSITANVVSYSAIFGLSQTVTNSASSLVAGESQTVNGFDYCFLTGIGNTASRSEQSLLGNSLNPPNDIIFAAGVTTPGISVAQTNRVQFGAGERHFIRNDANAVAACDIELDYAILLTNGAAQTVNLPAGVDGATFIIKDAAGVAGHSIVPNGAETIDGVAGAYVTGAPYRSVMLTFLGTNWNILAIA